MTRRLPLCASLLLALSLPATAASPAAPAFDPVQAWQQFLAKGELDTAIGAFDLMETVAYDGSQVNADACAQHRDDINKAIAVAPVSILVRRVAYLCAESVSDDAAAEREMTALAALSRHALAQAGDYNHPIRVLGAADATALVNASGMQVLSVTYEWPRPERYFPMVVVGWDAEAKVERHLTFDFVDTMYQIARDEPNHGLTVLRNGLVVSMVSSGDAELSARDIKAVRDSRDSDGLDQKLGALRPVAREGGLRAAFEWVEVCGAKPTASCGEGFVEAVLPRAEQQQALPMVLLAYAWLQGFGVERDEAAAWALLEAADRRWPNYGATAEFTRMWMRLHDDPIADADMPVALQKRLERAAADGNRFARYEALRRRVLSPSKPKLEAGDIAFLSGAAINGNGTGFALIADYHDRQGEPQLRLLALEKAADAGHVKAQALYGWELLYGTGARDTERGQRYVFEAAQGGQPWALRHMAEDRNREGQWALAEKWLLPAVYGGDVEALFDLGALYASERPGVEGKASNALEIFQSLADGDYAARARVSLADMATRGLGMKKNPKQAMQWLLPVAEKGDLNAQTRLGLGYLYGDFGKVDEAKAKRWLQAPLAARQGWASKSYGSWLYHNGQTPQARAQAFTLWEQSADAGMSGAYNELAWASCTSPYPDSFDPKRGMQTVAKMDDPQLLDLPELDTVAACHAAAGDFKRAVELQALALQRADALASKQPDYKETADSFRERLALYRANRHYIDEEDRKSL